MLPVVSSNRTDTDLSKMKFLVLALCVCAASAAAIRGSVGFRPWQQTAQAVAQVVSPIAPVETISPIVISKTVPTYRGVDAEAPVLRSESDVTAQGFNFLYETGNGIAAHSTGSLKKVDNTEALTIEGSYQYTAPDGTPVLFTYTADENGYQPRSDLLPVGPPVPIEIERALAYIAAHPQKSEKF